ncbi:MAG TPA: hypothetical protein VG265_14845, partial [Gaiellaceae bacterium]|nr:hypothetical protein [Gaiellaceae bacterium]
AIATWTNPFVTHALYAPSGVNLTWTPTAPGLALVFSPLTSLLGPVASFNVAMLLMPALSGWAAYLLCRELTRSVWASLIGGLLYGYSDAGMHQFLAGNLNLTAMFVPPLVALAVVRYVRSELGDRGLAWRLGVLIAVQLWISTEVALTLTIFLGLGLVLAFSFLRQARPRVLSSMAPVGAGYGIGMVLAAPFVAFLLIGFVSRQFAGSLWVWGTDPLGFVVPNKIQGIGGQWFLSFGNHTPNGDLAYLGPPALLVVCLFAFRFRRERSTWFLLAALLTATVVTLGLTLSVDGHKLLTFPWWDAAQSWPLVDNVLPFRLAAYVALCVAVIVAIWIDRTRGRFFARPYVLPVLAVVALVPAVWDPGQYSPGHPVRLGFFTDGSYRTCIPKNETLLALPIGGAALVWQAESGFWFKLADDGVQPIPEVGRPISSFDQDEIVSDLHSGQGTPTMDRLLAFSALHDVGRVVAPAAVGYPTRSQSSRLGGAQVTGGALVAPGCATKPLTTRNLTRYVAAYRQELAAPSRPSIGYCLPNEFTTLPEGMDPAGDLAGAVRAIAVAGVGLTCAAPPAGYKRRGFASGGVPPDTYAYYAP